MCTHIVIQDSTWKAEPPYELPVPWAGTVTHKKKGVVGIVSQEKW